MWYKHILCIRVVYIWKHNMKFPPKTNNNFTKQWLARISHNRDKIIDALIQ